MAEKQIEIVIKATDLSAKELDQARRALAGFKGEADRAAGGIGGLVKSLGPLGPALAGALSFGAIKSFASSLLDTADTLVKMSDKTGIGIEALQRLKGAATQGGNSIEEVTKAINKMQVNLAGEDKGAVKALDALGLSLSDLRAMNPEQQFTTIASAIQKVHDPADQAKLRVLLFGRAGNEIAGTLNQDFAQIAGDIVEMTDRTARALDGAGDRLQQYTDNIQATMANWLVSAIGAVERGVDLIIFQFLRMEVDVLETWATLSDWAAKYNLVPGVGEELRREADEIAAMAKVARDQMTIFAEKTAGDYAKAAKEAAGATNIAGRSLLDLGEEGRKTVPKLTEAERAAKDWHASIKEASEQMVWLTTSTLPGVAAGYSRLVPEVTASGAAMIEAARDANTWEGEIAGLTTSFAGVMTTLPPVVQQSKEFTEAMKEHTPFWKEHSKGLSDVASSFGLMSRAAEMAGKKTTASILTIAQAGIQAFAQGGPFAAALATAGAALSAFGDKLFKTEGRKVNDLRDEFIATAGGLHALNVKAHDAGLTLDRLLRAKTVQEYEAAVKELNDAFDAQANALEAQNRLLEEQARIRKELEDSIDATTREIADLRQSLIPTWEDVADAVDRYDLSVDGAGQRVQGLKLLSDTTKIVNDWEMLTRAGWDTNGMLDGMQDELSKVAQEAIKYGVELPAQMQPILQALADQGKLTDANGNKLKDLSGIKFGAPIESDADKINSAIQKLVDSLADLVEKLNGLPGVAQAVSQDLQAELGTPPWDDWPAPAWPDVESTGGGKGVDIPSFASGVRGFGGGLAVVGEEGPELVRLPRGADVIPMGTSGASMLDVSGGLGDGLAQAVAAAVASAMRQAPLRVSVQHTTRLNSRVIADEVARDIPAVAQSFGRARV